MYTDTIADLLTRIRNAARARHEMVKVPHSKVKEQILTLLKNRNFIRSYELITNGEKKTINISLFEDKTNINLVRISKPGQRIYVSSEEIKKVNGGMGLSIISTSKGIVSGEEAKKMNLGGEVICEVF